MMEKDYPNEVVGVHVIGDYMKMLWYLRRLEKIQKKKDYYCKLYKEAVEAEEKKSKKDKNPENIRKALPRKVKGVLCF